MFLRTLLLFLAVSLLSAVSLYRLGSYTITDDYVIHFDGRGAEGTFRGLQGTIIFDPAKLDEARMDVTVDATTIATGNTTKDKHARGDAWFDVADYPTIRYVADEFARTPSGYLAKGQLTLHGTTKSMDLPFTFTETAAGGGFAGEMAVSREAFGIEGPWLGFTVGDDFDVELRVEVLR